MLLILKYAVPLVAKVGFRIKVKVSCSCYSYKSKLLYFSFRIKLLKSLPINYTFIYFLSNSIHSKRV